MEPYAEYDDDNDFTALAGADPEERQWRDMPLPNLPMARGTTATVGPYLHAWLKFRLPGDPKVYMVTARVNMAEMLQEVTAHVGKRVPLRKRIKAKLKKAVKKVARSKIVQAVKKVAKKVWNNPLVKAVISATPMGAAIVATTAAARVAAKAIRGSVKAARTIKSIAARARGGDKGAIKAARLIKAGVKLTGIAPKLRFRSAGDEPNYLAEVMGACLQPNYDVDVPPLVGCGADEVDDDQELEAVEMFATSGAFEGLRWAAHQLAWRPDMGGPTRFRVADALRLSLEAAGR